MATATVTVACTAAAGVTIMVGAGAAGTITAGAIIVTTDTQVFAGDCFRRPIAPTKAGACIWTVAPNWRGLFDASQSGRRLAQPHLDRDPDQIRVILGAELLL